MRSCDTFSWFSAKVTIPIASSNDLILGGIQDILEAFRNPTPGSTIDPLTNSHHLFTLKILSELITGLITVPKPPLIIPASILVPPLRVATPQSPPPLRVDPIATPVGSILIPVNDSISQARIIPAPKLVPKIVPQDGPHVIPIKTANPMHIVLLAPTPTPPIIEYVSPLVATFENSTGSKGHRHCKATRKQPLKTKMSSPQQPLRTSQPSPTLGTTRQCLQP